MSTAQKEIRKKLQIERQVLSAQLRKLDSSENEDTISTIAFQMHSKMQIKLASIERALNRLEKGTFGICQSCGYPIDSARLEALPSAEQCIDCQRRLERTTIHRYVYTYSAY